MPVSNHGTVAVCFDCLIWHCNADDTGFCDCGHECVSDECAAIKQYPHLRSSFPDIPGHWLHLVPSDLEADECCDCPDEHPSHASCDLGFSMSRCDACGRPEGGDRFRMAVLTPS